MKMTDFWEERTPAAASLRSNSGSVSPPRPSAPTCRNARRDNRATRAAPERVGFMAIGMGILLGGKGRGLGGSVWGTEDSGLFYGAPPVRHRAMSEDLPCRRAAVDGGERNTGREVRRGPF